MAIIPIIALGLMVGLGVWGVLAASASSSNAKKDDARAAGVDAATGLEVKGVALPAQMACRRTCYRLACMAGP